MAVTVTGGTVVALLALIATIDLAQFAITIRHTRKIAKIESETCDSDSQDDGNGRHPSRSGIWGVFI